MKNENLSLEATEKQIDNACADFNPFGWLDMKAAVSASLQAGKQSDFVYECVSEFSESCETKIEDCDPVFCVMDAILQEARNEIAEATKFDISNDCTGTEFYTAGNFMCTSYDYGSESKKQLIDALAENDIVIDNLEDATQYFLDGVEISQEDIEAAKKELQSL